MKALGITKIGQRKKLAKEISKASSAERVSGSQSASHTRSTRTGMYSIMIYCALSSFSTSLA